LQFKEIAAKILTPILRYIPKNRKWLYPFYLAGQLNVQAEEVYSSHLPQAFDGFSIAYASDFHYGPYFGDEEADSLIEQLLSLGADLLILGGDYGNVQASSTAFFNYIEAFSETQTVLAVLGNHDYSDENEAIKPLLQAMRDKNVKPLVNEVWTLNRQGVVLAVCAPDDMKCGQPDFELLRKGAEDADFILFTPHSPDLIPEAEKAGFSYHLALCGHTHGGQILLFRRSLQSSSIYGDRYRAGWYKEQGTNIFVSSGVGTSILPMRLHTRSEIHKFTLRAKL
jgi:predicted MPP superfamily phosphohydrolase